MVDLATGTKIEAYTDIAWSGARGGVSLTRTFTTSLARGNIFGRFGRGTKDNFDIRLTGNFVPGGSGRVLHPEKGTGRLFSYTRTDPDGSLVFTTRDTIGQLGDVLRKKTDGTFEYRKANGEVSRFDATGRLMAIVDRNSSTTTLTYTGANLTRITDPVGRVRWCLNTMPKTASSVPPIH